MLKKIGIAAMIVAIMVSSANADRLRIMAENVAPVNFIKDGEWSGATAEVVKEILRRLDQKNAIEEVPWARGYQIVQEAPNTVLFSMARTPERENLFHWVGPVSIFQSGFYARKDSKISIRSLDEARLVKRIGTYRNDVRETFLLQNGFRNLQRTNSNESNLRKLLTGRIDLWATSNIEAASVPRQYGEDPTDLRHVYSFQKFVLYIAISKQTPLHIVRGWQHTLDRMKADGSFASISRRWLPADSLPEEILTPSSKADLDDVIRIFTENAPPGSYIEGKDLKGPSVRIVQEIIKRLSINASIEVVPWARGYHMAQTQPNVALFATSRLPHREKMFKWVGPLYTQRWGFYKKKDARIDVLTMADAKNVGRIGTYHEDAKEQYLRSLGFVNLISTNNNIGNVQHLMEGRIDLWVSSDFNMPYIVRYAGYDPQQIALALSFKTIGNYIAFSPMTSDRHVNRWQTALDELRRDGTVAQVYGNSYLPID